MPELWSSLAACPARELGQAGVMERGGKFNNYYKMLLTSTSYKNPET